MRRLGISIHSTGLSVTLLDERAQVIQAYALAISGHDYDQLLLKITEVATMAGPQCALGVAVAGQFGADHTLSRTPFPWLDGRALEDDLRFALKRDLFVDTAGSCFTLAEATVGAGRTHAMVVGILLDSPPSGGLAQDGVLWRGRRNDTGGWRRLFDSPLYELAASDLTPMQKFDEVMRTVAAILNPTLVVIGGELEGVAWTPGVHPSGVCLVQGVLGDAACSIGAAMMGV